MNSYPDQKLSHKRWSQTHVFVFSGILVFVAGIVIWIIGALQKQILETQTPGLKVDIFPPIGILILGVVLCIIGIALRKRKA